MSALASIETKCTWGQCIMGTLASIETKHTRDMGAVYNVHTY